MTKRTWVTPALSANQNPTAADLQRVFSELHTNLVSAGLVVADDVGQLDFATITTYTASKEYGYRIYQLNDGLSLPLFLKIRFLSSMTTGSGQLIWAFIVSIGFGSNGSGALTSPSTEYRIGVQESGFVTAGVYTPLNSYICVTKGFIGVSLKHCVASGLATYAPSNVPADYPSLASFFVCRDTNDAGEPTSDGATLFVIAPGGMTYSTSGEPPVACHLSPSGAVVASNRVSIALGGDYGGNIGGKVPMSHIYTMTPKPKRISQLMCVNRAPGMQGIDEIDAVNVGTATRQYLVMPPVWPADGFTLTKTRSCIAMLWE